jgi:hypothetical protein
MENGNYLDEQKLPKEDWLSLATKNSCVMK